jgi:murein DD-endopeptidase MepM/ murein hydrolase activator NlpD
MITKRIILVSAMFLLTILVAGFPASTQDVKTTNALMERRLISKLTDQQTQGATVSTQNVASGSPRAGRENIRSMRLIGGGAGWVLTKGRLFWTNSSGQQWLDITPRTPALISVDSVFFSDASAGWAVLSERDSKAESGHSLKLASTTDTGKSWSFATVSFPGEFPADYAGVVSVDFVDALHGWIMLRLSSSSNFSRGVLLMTSDGGNSWRRLSDPPIGSPTRFVTATNGWLAGGPNGDELYWTQNGGESWKPRSVLPPSTVHKNSQRTYELPTFEKQQDAILPVSFTGPQGLIKVFYRTQNGGESWEQGTMSTSAHPDAYIASSVVNSKTVIVAQSNNAEIGILEEGRKGRTKGVAKIASADQPFTKIDFVTQDEGWLLVTHGKCRGFKSDCIQETKLFATADGGQVLTEITPGVGSPEKTEAEDTTPPPNISRENIDAISPDGAIISIQNKEGFDKCAVPTVAQMQVWWNSSPYKAANVYIGGENHSCKTQAISSSWISSVMSMGWGLIPTWVGPQAPSVYGNCAANCTKMSTNSTTAEAQGVAEADKAADQAVAYGLSGSIIYYDMEAYDSNASGAVVKAFMNGWVRRLKERGFDGAGYSSRLNVSDWANIANPPAAIWFTWFFQNGVPCGDSCHSVFGVPSISDSLWVNHQRIRQTSSGFNRCWSTTCLTIDEDWLDGPVAGGTSPPPPTSNTTDGFDYPVGKPNATGYAITGWDFLDWTGSVYHPAEDWNGSGGGDTDLGDPVYATANGTVVAAGNYGSGWGNIILVKHDLPGGGNVWSQYAHLQNILVSSGTVSRGQQIGTIGKGYNNEYFAHLHFEIRKISLAADAWVAGLSQAQIQDRYYRPSTFVNANRPSSNASPSISSVSPNPVTGVPLPGRVALTLNGANFVNKPTVFMTWTGGSATLSSTNVTFVSSSRLDLSVATDAEADDWTVRVTNPDGKVSNTATFSVVTQTPTISVSATSLSNFGSVGVGQNSVPQSYTVSGNNLSADVTIQAPTGFQISQSSTSGFTDTLTLTRSAGSVPATTIYARFSPQTSGGQTGNISHTSSGATARYVSVSGTGTIDSAGTVQFSSSTYSVNENGGSRTITLTRTGGTNAFIVNYGTSNGTATAGADYTGLDEVLSFATNETSKTFTVPIINDTSAEGNETLNLTLSNPSGGVTLGSPNTAVLTIVDDDTACTYSLSTLEHTVSPGSVSVNIFMDAPSGCAWTAVSDSPSWLTTSSSGSGDGTVSYQTAENPSTSPRVGHITVGGQVHTVTQIGIGGAGTVRFSSASYTANEAGGNVTITVTRTGGTGTGTVQYSTSDGTATAGTDYVATSGTLLFVGDQTSKSFDVTILDDTTVEGNESFSLSLMNNSSSLTLGSPSTATLTISDNDTSSSTAAYDSTLQAPKCSLPGSVCDSGTLLNGRGNITDGAEPNQPNTIYGSCMDGTSGTYHKDESIDRIKLSTLDGGNFAPGKTVKIEVDVWAWGTDGYDHLDLYYAPDATNPSWTYIATLDTANTAGAQLLSTTFTLPGGGSLQAVRAHFRFAGDISACGTDNYDDHDDLIFAASTGAAPSVTTKAANSVTGTGAVINGSVNPNGAATSGWFEWGTSPTLSTFTKTGAQSVGSGTAAVAISAGIGGLSPGTTYYFRAAASNAFGTRRGNILSFTATATLPSLKVNNISVSEATGTSVTALFTVSLYPASSQTVTVQYATANVSATAPADYLARALNTLTFSPGEISKTVYVVVIGDAFDEQNEAFRLLLSNPAGATIATATGTCTILDNDAPPRMTINNVTATEPDTGVTYMTFTVRLSARSGRNISVKYATSNGTAAAGSDYTAVPLTTLIFQPGQSSKTFRVAVRGDTAAESNETFFVNLSQAVNATISDSQGLGTILNDD